VGEGRSIVIGVVVIQVVGKVVNKQRRVSNGKTIGEKFEE